MAKEDTKDKARKGLEDLFLILSSLKTTGTATIRLDVSDGIVRNYGYSLENKSCIRDGKTVR